ncbi:MAG: hypothetical protein AAB726_01550 [Patescibacteria group bacterium]
MPEPLIDEVALKIEEFKNSKNHDKLKVHKLHSTLKGCFSFSVNYNIRIIFEYGNSRSAKSQAILLGIGKHDQVY